MRGTSDHIPVYNGSREGEVYFRDTAHGFLAWALASVLGAILLASPATSLLGGAASGATQAAANSAQSSGPMDGYVDTLLRSDTPAGQNSTNPAESRGELARILTTSFHNGSDFNPADRAYAAKVVSAQTGLSQADADKRVENSFHALRNSFSVLLRTFQSRANQGNVRSLGLTILNGRSTINRLAA